MPEWSRSEKINSSRIYKRLSAKLCNNIHVNNLEVAISNFLPTSSQCADLFKRYVDSEDIAPE